MDVRKHNQEAWDRKVAEGSRWTRPVDAGTIARARSGDWSVVLTPARPVPRDWFPDLEGCRVLGLASGGGQQGPILAAAGAEVTILDNSEAQLARDREVAEREGLPLRTLQGDMMSLASLADESFDLVFHPVANCFIPDPRPVWREAHRVLRPGGNLLSGFMNPTYYIFHYATLEQEKRLEVAYALPYSDQESMTAEEFGRHLESGEALEFSHTMDLQIGGQLEAGFILTRFYEDRFGPEVEDPVSRYMPVSFATRARKTVVSELK